MRTPRPARPEKAAAVRAAVRDAYAPWVARIGREPGPMGDDYARRVADGQAWLVEDDGGRVVGVLVVQDDPGDSAALLLDNVAVVPAAQGRGVGRALIAFAEDETRRRGRDRVRLYTNALMAENVALYRRLGYAETARRREAGFDRVFLEKRLAAAAPP